MTVRSLTVFLTGALALACGDASPVQPNVVLIVLETETGGHAETPHLSRLATEGIFYLDAFAHSPAALPALTALLSARTPLEAGVITEGRSVPPELPTLARWLGDNGYRTSEGEAAPDLEPFFWLVSLAGTHAEVDERVGSLRADLEARGTFDDALVVLTSRRTSATGLSDAVLRAPVVIKPPAGHPRTADLERAKGKTVRHIDVVPTLLDVLGLPELPGATGSSLCGGTLRVLLAEAHGDDDVFCLRDDRYKLVYRPASGAFEMFDLAADPDETSDVFETAGGERAPWKRALVQSAERVNELRARGE